MKKIYFLALIFVFLGSSSSAGENFWLTGISSLGTAPKGLYPKLEDPKDKTGDVSVITINDGRVVYNGEYCNYEVSRVKDFRINRVLAESIDEVGGIENFNSLLNYHLKTSISKWKKEYVLKDSNLFLDSAPCELLQHASIYRSDKDLIIWDTIFFYKFQLGKEFKYGD